jgi:hypothetical protein
VTVDKSTVRGRDEGGLRIKTRARASQIVRPRCLVQMLGEIDSTASDRARGTNYEDRRGQNSGEEDERFEIELEHL